MKKIAVEEHWFKEALDRVEERLRDMDEAGIDMQVLSATLPPGRQIGVADAQAWARDTNDAFARLIDKYPKRFSSFASIALHDPDFAAREMERAVTQLGFKGTMIGSEISGYLDEPEYGVLLETAERLDVPIYLHPRVPASDMVKPYLAYPILSRSMWGFAAEAGLHAMRLICGGIFEKYPHLKIILGHLGEGIPYWLWRLDNRWLNEKDGREGDFEADISASLMGKKPSEYFKENFYVTTSGMFWPPALQLVLSALSADRILFAVDYAAESNKVAAEFIESMPMSYSDKEKICHLNTEKLLRL